MSIIYIYTFDDPAGVGPIPPTFLNHPQGAKLHNAVSNTRDVIAYNNGKNVMFFDSEDELVAWINENRITDPALLADIETWNRAYNIVHHHTYYSATKLNLTLSPVF